MGTHNWRGIVAAALLAVMGLAWGLWSTPASRPAGMPLADSAPTRFALTGTNSCSGRGCHGSLEPLSVDGPQQNEFTTWVLRDRHADAYRVLYDERSKKIAQRLFGKEAVAHTQERCLACHVVPQAAADPERYKDVLSVGVGCEACHGPAQKWKGRHFTEDWKKLDAETKQREYGMTPTSDLPTLARICAGCHVGAPPDKERGLPLRDVNHDLIAAGHPRLDFDFGAFLANMPAHWRKEKKPNLEDGPAVWAVGQMASAQAALALLEFRARDAGSPWPEFAESSCFACHHGLQDPGWRAERLLPGKRVTVPWNEWYFMMPRVLAPEIAPSLDSLRKEMARPVPSRTQVADQAAKLLAAWPKGPDKRDRDALHKVLNPFVKDPKKLDALDWDEAAQLYLAAAALVAGDETKHAELLKLHRLLAFPSGDDPPPFEVKVQRKERLDSLRESLGALLK